MRLLHQVELALHLVRELFFFGFSCKRLYCIHPLMGQHSDPVDQHINKRDGFSQLETPIMHQGEQLSNIDYVDVGSAEMRTQSMFNRSSFSTPATYFIGSSGVTPVSS